MTRLSVWGGGTIAGLALLLGGFWLGHAVPTSSATPRRETGIVAGVNASGDAFDIRLGSSKFPTGFSLPDTTTWRDRFGSWHDDGQPACMRGLSHGQRITIGVVNINPAGDTFGGTVVAWLECPRAAVPPYPIATPHPTATG